MKFSAVQKFTVLDYPDKTACIVFTPGCNFRCGFCHNPEFVLPERIKELESDFIDEAAVLSFLETRRGLLQGVVVTGGEPTLQRELPAFLAKVRSMGFATKLDTNGSLPEILEPILDKGLVDYVAMDVKTSLENYTSLAGCFRPEAIRTSLELIRTKVPEYEFRTTIVKEHHGPQELEGIAKLIQGANRYVLQGFRPNITLDPKFQQYAAVTRPELEKIAEFFRPFVKEVIIH